MRSLSEPTSVFVIGIDRHLDLDEPIALANSVEHWLSVGCVRVNVRSLKSHALFGKGQIEKLRHKIKHAVAEGRPTDGSTVLPAVDKREWQAWKLDDGEDYGVSPFTAAVPAAVEDPRAWRASQLAGGAQAIARRIARQEAEMKAEAVGLIIEEDGEDEGDEPEGIDEAAETAARLLEEPIYDDGDEQTAVHQAPEDRPPYVVFVDVPDLRPSQQRHLQDAWGCPVYDRFGVVLAIFKSRAQSPEAKLRLELATLGFKRSRLVDSLANMDQQRGGIGMRSGAGESLINAMRSRLRAIRAKLSRRLGHLSQKADSERHKRRSRSAEAGRRKPVVALIGYTNAGKSLLHAQLAGGAGDPSRARDALFASLDTKTLSARFADGSDCLVVDTVGFVRDLSHGLVECFHATLQETLECDAVVLVVDASDPRAEAQRETVLQTLRTLKLDEALLESRIELHNKADRLNDEERQHWHAANTPSVVRATGDEDPRRRRRRRVRRRVGSDGEWEAAVTLPGRGEDQPTPPSPPPSPLLLLGSARTGEGLDALNTAICQRVALRTGRNQRTIDLPASGAITGERLSFLHRHPRVTVLSTDVSDDGDRMFVTIEADENAFAAYDGHRWEAK